MRKVLLLAAVLAVASLAIPGTPALAQSSCTTVCTNATLFCAPTNSCTSSPGQSITCDGVTTQCSVANAWCACTADCDAQCEAACDFKPTACSFCMRNCQNSCGTRPANLSHC